MPPSKKPLCGCESCCQVELRVHNRLQSSHKQIIAACPATDLKSGCTTHTDSKSKGNPNGFELELRATFRWFFSCCMQLHSSPEFPRFLTSPDNRADCCPCTDCQVERGATLSRRFSARRPHPAPASPPPAPRPRANPFISSFQFTNPPPRARVTCRPGLLLPGYLRARRLDKSAPLGETCKACDSI